MAINLFNKMKILFSKKAVQAEMVAGKLEIEHIKEFPGLSAEQVQAEGERRQAESFFSPFGVLSNQQKEPSILPTGYTENYGLVKPGQNDFYDIEVGNSNLDVIDELIKEKGEAIEDIAGPGRTSQTVVGAYAAAEAAMPTPVVVSLPASSWILQEGLLRQTIALPGMGPEDLVVSCLPETLTLAQAKAIGKAVLVLRNQQPGNVDVVCLGTVPAIDVPFSILWYGGGN